MRTPPRSAGGIPLYRKLSRLPTPSASSALGASPRLGPAAWPPLPSPLTLGLGSLRAHSPYLWHLDLPDDQVDLLGVGACLGILETIRLPKATAAVH